MRINPNQPVNAVKTTSSAAAPAKSEAVAAPAAGWTAKAKATGAVAPAAVSAEARSTAAAQAFFKAFEAHDTAAIENSYRPDAHFKDDMFNLTKRSSIMNMWSKAPPFAAFNAEVISAKGNEVKAKWTADYVIFGNKVHNEIESTMTFDDQGKIASQVEHWDRQKWMSQAIPAIPKFLQPVAYFFMRPLLTAQVGG